MNKIIALKFGDLFLKGKNRGQFINQLHRDVKRNINDLGEVIKKHDLIEIHTNDIEPVLVKVKHVFGISKIDIGYKFEKDVEVAIANTVDALKNETGTFKVECKRQDKTFQIKSEQLKLDFAAKILANTELKVDVRNPNHLVRVTVAQDGFYVFTRSLRGAGGFPAGSSGKVLVLLSGGIDSPVAGYQLASRGAKVDFIHFESPPSTKPEALQKVYDLHEIFRNFQPSSNLYVSNFTDIQNEIFCSANESYRITLMRRFFVRIACKFALENGYQAIATGDSLGQVASQTLESMFCITNAATIPMFRPLLTMDKIDIIKIAKDIGTYETSIRPFEDCCSLFTPKNPVTKPKLEKVLEQENKMMVTNIEEDTVKEIKLFESYKK